MTMDGDDDDDDDEDDDDNDDDDENDDDDDDEHDDDDGGGGGGGGGGLRVVVVVHGKVQCWLFAVCFLRRQLALTCNCKGAVGQSRITAQPREADNQLTSGGRATMVTTLTSLKGQDVEKAHQRTNFDVTVMTRPAESP